MPDTVLDTGSEQPKALPPLAFIFQCREAQDRLAYDLAGGDRSYESLSTRQKDIISVRQRLSET